MPRLRLFLPVVLLLLLAASRLACASPIPSAVVGSWRVVKQFACGIPTTKRGRGEAKETTTDVWIGTKVVYAETSAQFGAHRCPKPAYSADSVDAASYLGEGFRIPPKRLGITEKQVDVITITCAGRDWLAPGSLLVVKSPRRLLAFWDGAFLELAR